jgi:hypothetical protein
VLFTYDYLPTNASISHSTVVDNHVINQAPGNYLAAGGLLNPFNNPYLTPLAINNTIVAANTAPGFEPDVAGPFASGGRNLIGVLGAGATGFTATDLKGTAASPLDPLLKPLGWYGGPTKTHALRKGSPAINAGDNTGAPATDQRGSDRVFHRTIDIGSYESKFGNNGVDASEKGQGIRSVSSSVLVGTQVYDPNVVTPDTPTKKDPRAAFLRNGRLKLRLSIA